jgi:hypothetical protein
MAGRRIDDHSFWAGKPGKDSRFPDGARTKDETTAEGAGAVMHYEDTTEAIKSSQEMGERQIKKRPLKVGTIH